MKTRQQVLSEYRRTEILNAARMVFAREGFERGMIETIAQEAGIAKGTVYLYFRSKQEIFRAVLHHDMRELTQQTIHSIEAASSLREKLRSFILVRLKNAEARKDFFRIMDSEQRNLTMTRSQYRDFLRDPVHLIALAIEAAVQTGEIKPVPCEKVAWMLADSIRGVIQRRLLGTNDSTLTEDADFLTAFFWASLKNFSI